jgi:hypothetical protein
MTISEYKPGDLVDVLINNIRLDNKKEWRPGEVIDKRTIHPGYGEHHHPYPILIVRTTRTYCKAEPIYRWVDNIPIYFDSNLEFYDKENDEGIIYPEQIRLRLNP